MKKEALLSLMVGSVFSTGVIAEETKEGQLHKNIQEQAAITRTEEKNNPNPSSESKPQTISPAVAAGAAAGALATNLLTITYSNKAADYSPRQADMSLTSSENHQQSGSTAGAISHFSPKAFNSGNSSRQPVFQSHTNARSSSYGYSHSSYGG